MSSVDLKAMVPGSKNFFYYEFIESDTAKRLGIDNMPTSDSVWRNIEYLTTYALQPIRDKFGPIRITSGYRSIPLCLAIGSTTHSNHIYGTTADIEPIDSNIKLIDIMEYVVNNLKWKELIAEYFPSGWVHICCEQNVVRDQIKLKDHHHNYSIMSFDEIKRIYK